METKATLLMIEDEQEVLNHYKKSLVSAGYTILEANDGEAGLKLALKKHPQLVLLDLLLPGMDGVEVLREIRKDSTWGRRVPVIVITNLQSPEVVIKTSELGVFDYLVKSQWSIQDVVMKVGIQLAGKQTS